MPVTKLDMVVEIARKTGLQQEQVKRLLQLTLDGIIDALAREGRIELRNFGVFEVRTRKPRKARNPRTGEVVMLNSRKVVVLKPGKVMEERVAAPLGERERPAS